MNNEIIKEKLNYIKSKGFIINDEKKAIKYIKEVGLYKLSKYFINFNDQKNIDFNNIINHYLFDQKLRNLNLGILEVIENTFKAQFILHIGRQYNNSNYYIIGNEKEKMQFINDKIEYFIKNDPDFKNYNSNNYEIFINKLTFGEIFKLFKYLKKEHKYKIIDFYGIRDLKIFENWIFCLKYLRNLSSHGDNIFNRKMNETIKGKKILEVFNIERNNVFISYFGILSLFNKLFKINNFYEKDIYSNLEKYNIDYLFFGQKKYLPQCASERGMEGHVQVLYDFYIKKSKDLLEDDLINNDNNKKTILITGGTGYIGSHGVVAFEQAGYKTVIIDNLSNSSEDTLIGIDKILGYKPDFFEIDLRDINKLEEIFNKYDFDGVIHFAGLKAVGESCEKPLEYFDNNVVGSIKLFECMEKFNVKNIIFSSTATVYDTDNIFPYNENQKTGKTSNTYSTTKFLIEKILLDLSKFSGFNVMNLRYFNPIGAHESGLIGENPEGIPNNLLPFIMKVAVGEIPVLKIFGNDYNTKDGTGMRDYIDINDLIIGHLKAYEKLLINENEFNVYNLGVGKATSVLKIVKIVESTIGKKINTKIVGRREGDLAEFYCNADKAKNDLLWEANISLEESIKNSWKFYNKK